VTGPRLDGAAGAEGPDPEAPWWTTTDVARFLGVSVGTVSSYRGRQQMPAPLGKIGSSHVWTPASIMSWQSGRPRSRKAKEERR
jgi:hypothetical protein